MLTEKEISVLNRLEQDISYENYFLKKVRDLKWFLPLKEKDYFRPEKVSQPIPDKEGKYYSIPEWNVLAYLERVSEQVNSPFNDKYIDELLQIIKNVSNYTDANGEHIDNYRTWWYFVKILLNIPKTRIPIDVIELIPVWLDSKFNASHIGSEIGLKLLPKFLSGEPSHKDITKAEFIVDYITDIKSIKLDEEKTKLYSRGDKFKLKVDPYWVKEVFEKHSKDIGEKCTNSIIDVLCDRIRSLLKRDESKIPLEAGSNAYLLTLVSEDDKYSVKVFDMGEKSKANIYEYVLMNKVPHATPLKGLSIDKTSMDVFVTQVYDKLVTDTPFSELNADDLKKDTHNLYRNYHDQGTYSSFHDESRTHLTEPLEVLTFVLKSILMARARKHVYKTKDILKSFFNDKYFYFPKMALYIIGNNIVNYEDVFWAALDVESDYFFYESTHFGGELRRVLEGLLPLSPEYKERLKTIVDEGPRKKIGEKDEKYILQWKQERYHALINDPDFKELYESLKSQTNMDVSLHSAVGEIKIRSGEGPAPLTKEEILQMSNEKLAAYLSTFKTKGFWEEGSTVGGLARLIKECASEKPNKFIENFSPFIDTGFIYIYEILNGSREAWNKKQDIAWGNLFEFVHQYIDRDEFWKDKLVVEKDEWLGGANHFWIIGVVTELIREGTRDDSRAFDEKYLKEAEEILFLIFDNLEVEKEEDKSDYVTHALNSPYEKTLAAFINLTLRIARVNDKKGVKDEIKWSEKIKGKYDELLEKKIVESYTLLGRYLPNLSYLDKKWAEEKVKSLYLETASRYWEAFMDGYLSIGKVYETLYELMIPHYERGITYEFKEKRDNERLVQHIALGYLLEQEDINNPESLFRKVLDAWDPEQILNIVSFFWSDQKYIGDEKEESKKIVDKIIFFWKWVYSNKCKEKSEADITDDDKKIQSDLARLTVFLPGINEEYSKWLMLATPYANENYNSSFFVEYLDKFDDAESIGHVGKIFLKMLKHFIPDFRQEHIRSIVEKLYKNDYKDDADKICNIYGMKGDEFLRDLYERYNATSQ